jgi:hypothetical protein
MQEISFLYPHGESLNYRNGGLGEGAHEGSATLDRVGVSSSSSQFIQAVKIEKQNKLETRLVIHIIECFKSDSENEREA